ncbi:hypothetical protein V7152_13025 [Neobacillus drentensis]|uniref:hypothetical protein n=1 Tax=Neobacillus drentensis TaxID=220684 RepID=UPI002FFF9A66
MRDILNLAHLFKEFQIYPKEKFSSGSPFIEFQRLYPKNYYSQDIDLLIELQDYSPIRRGADLPWWGEQFFQNTSGPKVMLIAQDSNALDAGSVVIYAHLFNEIPLTSGTKFTQFINRLSSSDLFKYQNWKRAFQQLKDWELNLTHLYITDAKKVYKPRQEVRKDSFDNAKSSIVLEEEIKIVNPDYIITLGSQAFNLLSSTSLLSEKINYADAVECGELIQLSLGKLIVSPFITGQCHTSPNFKERKRIAKELIHREISSKYLK